MEKFKTDYAHALDLLEKVRETLGDGKFTVGHVHIADAIPAHTQGYEFHRKMAILREIDSFLNLPEICGSKAVSEAA